MRAIYPYVAKGDAEATHLISRWFANYASVQTTPTVTRNLDRNDSTDEHSLILFGSASSNRFIRNLMQAHEDLPITLETRTRVSVSAPLTPQEQQQIADLEKKGAFRVVPAERGCILDFSSGTYWPAILTRLPNPHITDIPTTVFNTDFGMAVCALAAILTNEPRLRRSFERLELPEAPEYFQFLYCVEARNHGPKQVVEPIAWFGYKPRGI